MANGELGRMAFVTACFMDGLAMCGTVIVDFVI